MQALFLFFYLLLNEVINFNGKFVGLVNLKKFLNDIILFQISNFQMTVEKVKTINMIKGTYI